jgi:hypothetical protein
MVEKIKMSAQEAKDGKYIEISTAREIEELLGL